jgi:hypothetical protein
MFRSAIARSLRASAPRVIKTPAPFHIRSSPIAAIPQFTPFQGARLYSAPAGLSKNEAEGRIVNLLKNFDKVRHIVFPGNLAIYSAMYQTTSNIILTSFVSSVGLRCQQG